MKFSQPFFNQIFALATLFFTPSATYASQGIPLQDQLPTQGSEIGATYKISRIEPLILGLVAWAMIIAALILFFCLILSAFQWLISGGNSNQAQAARGRITNCLLGLSVTSLSLAIMYIIQHFFGLTIFPGA